MIDDSDRLKPCPFCGAAAEIITLAGEEEGVGVGAQCVQCTSSACGAAGGLIYPLMDDVTDLLHERWNKRASQTEKQCATCGYVGQEDPVKGCPKCGFDDMRAKASEHRDGRLAALEEVATLKLALTALLNDPAVIEAAQPGDIGRALCAVRGI